MPFTAEQYYTTDPPGFLWVVRFKIIPTLAISGRDRYADGTGSIRMRLLYPLPVADKSGGGLNQGGLLRYLNETMWFPAAALSPYITWEAIDAHSSRATMSYGGVTVSAVFAFDDQGQLTDMTAERFNDARGGMGVSQGSECLSRGRGDGSTSPAISRTFARNPPSSDEPTKLSCWRAPVVHNGPPELASP